MRLVVDSNVLFTYFWKDSVFSKIVEMEILTLYAPEFALVEIKKYETLLMKKAKITQHKFNTKREQLLQKVTFVPLEDYASFIKETTSLKIYFSEDQHNAFYEDIDFFTLAIALRCPIWTHDSLFKKQPVIPVFSTREIIAIL